MHRIGPIDNDQARHIAQQAVSGLMSETAARSSLRWLALMSDTPRALARRFCRGAQKYLEDDVVDQINDLIARKVLQDDGHGLDLHRVARGTPFSAFVRGLVSNAQASIMRNVSALRRNTGTDTTFTTTEDEFAFDAGWADSRSIPFDAVDTGAIGERIEVEDIEDMMRTRGKSLSRVHLAARYLARRYRVRVPTRRIPDGLRVEVEHAVTDRATVRQAIADSLAGSNSPRHPVITSLLESSFTRRDLSILAEAPVEVGVAIVRATTTPRPALARNVKNALVALVADRADGQGWSNVAARLVHGFAQAIADLPNENANAFRTAIPRSDAAAGRDWAAFRELAVEASRYPGAPMGSTGGCVEIELETMLAQVEVTIAAALAEDSVAAVATKATTAARRTAS